MIMGLQKHCTTTNRVIKWNETDKTQLNVKYLPYIYQVYTVDYNNSDYLCKNFRSNCTYFILSVQYIVMCLELDGVHTVNNREIPR